MVLHDLHVVQAQVKVLPKLINLLIARTLGRQSVIFLDIYISFLEYLCRNYISTAQTHYLNVI